MAALTAVFVVSTAVLHAQSAQFQIPLTLEAASGPVHSTTLYFGISGDGAGGTITDNTYSIDIGSTFGDYEEVELPPPPPVPIFDVRFKDIPGRTPGIFGTGIPEDYRGYTSMAQVDSYFVQLLGTDLTANSLRISWPSNLALFGTSWLLKSQFGLFPEVDMLTATETTVNGALAAAGGVLIIKTGAMGTTDVELVNLGLPKEFSLLQNYPNPFNPSTEIRFSVPKTTHVRLSVYNTIGQLVETLVNEEKSAGNYVVRFNASRFSSGVYHYRLDAGFFSETRSMMLVK
jgi:hypothetical protein